MKITPSEIYVMINALEARKEWIEDEKLDVEELKHIDLLLKKLNKLNFEFSFKENEN